jgi:hypothetical protein
MRVSLPSTAQSVAVSGPNGEKIEVSPHGNVVVVPAIAHVGFYQIAWQGPQAGSMLVPANLTSVPESDLTAKPIPGDGQTITVTQAKAEPEAHHEWSWVLALGALALIVFDVWYWTRDPRARSPVAGPAVARPRLPERRPV